MKAIKRKTGEVVEIIAYSGTTTRSVIDSVSYIDSQGIEHANERLNFYWDFESIDSKSNGTETKYWQDVRERAAIAAIQGILSAPVIEGVNPNPTREQIVEFSVALADEFVEQLKNKY